MKTMVIVGAGKLLGLSMAKEFGKQGFHIVMIARNEQHLQQLQQILINQKISSSIYSVDICNLDKLANTFKNINKSYGKIDILAFSPNFGHINSTNVLDLKPNDIDSAISGNLKAAIQSVNAVLSKMLSYNSGALLFTTGLSSIYPNSNMSESTLAKSALRNYILMLDKSLIDQNIFVGHISLGIFLKENSHDVSDPDTIAQRWYEKYKNNEHGEELYPLGVTPETIIK
ncbi:SDR family oxidoreductase [Leuconostoc suionicum]|uniref:SDR family oxidoreductase n=1 Tax=Leuconostoc suionicum TaxID=1511761 RepID=UPI0024AD87BA|nr:SDR family oxidoreductase [Leuconostoc suionicum]MDI6523810.1 SDR family oxidoreductase [Leuconostoc suionicum]